jgi:hypothetical protein
MTLNHHLTALVLAYPPVTNREGDYVKDEEAVQDRLNEARLYAIAQRPELVFRELDVDDDNKIIRFAIGSNDDSTPLEGDLDLKLWPGFEDVAEPTLDIGNSAPGRPPSGIKVWDGERDDKFFLYITPLRLLFWRSREHLAVSGLDDYRSLLKFDLHYFGRSDQPAHRLLLAGHEKRAEILSRVHARVAGATISDELVVMFFTAETLLVTELVAETPAPPPPSLDAAMRDAEKALVHVLKPNFNKELYVKYPKGSDGLYGSALIGYGHIIGEDITLCTESATMSGDRGWRTNAGANALATMIHVVGGGVSVVSPH